MDNKIINEKLIRRNQLWVAINFIFPKWRRRGEKHISKFIKYRVYVDEEQVFTVDVSDPQSFLANLKIGCSVNILRVHTEPKNEKVLSNFLFVVGESNAVLFLNKDESKVMTLDFANQNRIEVLDDRDYDFVIENKEKDVTKNQAIRQTGSRIKNSISRYK